LPDVPWRVTGEHNHYVITWPIPGGTVPKGGPAAPAEVRPLDGGRWSIDQPKLPPSGSFSGTVPDPDAQAKGSRTHFHYTIDGQDSRGVIDPSLSGVSSTHAELRDITLATDSAKQHQEQRIDRYVAESNLAPVQGGRLDAISTVTV